MTRFDILMPAFNAERTIAQSIQSVLDQTLTEWHLWIVDDGSTDRTAQTVEPFLSDPRISLLRQSNKRMGAARNAALRAGTAPLVCFLDSDDLWLPHKLESQNAAIEASGATVTFSDGEIFIEGEPSSVSAKRFETLRGYYTGQEMLKMALLRNQIPILSASVRRAAIEEANGFEETFFSTEDYDLWIRLAEKGADFYGIDAYLVRYRRHLSSVTTEVSAKVMLSDVAVWERHFETARAVGVDQELRAKLKVFYHTAALKFVKEGRVRQAKALFNSASARRWDGKMTSWQRRAFNLFPRPYRALYEGLGRLKTLFKA